MGEDQVPGSVPPTAEQDGDPQSLTSCVTARQYWAVPHLPLSNCHPEPRNVAPKQTPVPQNLADLRREEGGGEIIFKNSQLAYLYILLFHKIHLLEWYVYKKIFKSLILSFHTDDIWCPPRTSHKPHKTFCFSSFERSQRFEKSLFYFFTSQRQTKIHFLSLKSFLSGKLAQLWFFCFP